MGWRSRKLQLEAQLKSVKKTGFFSAGPSGKMEATWYTDGERLEVKARGLKLPDGSTLDVYADEDQIASLTIEAGRGKIDNEAESLLPPLEVGQTVEIRYQDEALLRGQLYRD